MFKTCAVILAAGEGSRMKTDLPKVLSSVLFKPMIQWVVDSVKNSNIADICVITGFKFEMVQNYLRSVSEHLETVVQNERKGTAHAVLTAKEFLKKHIDSDVLILNGDAPFIDEETIKNAYRLHISENNAATIISAKISNPFGYGRIVRDSKTNNVISIVEQKDADSNIKLINEVNSGAYWFNVKSLLEVLDKIKNNNSQGEFYLTDAISMLINQKQSVSSFTSFCEDTVLGANNMSQLGDLNEIARKKTLRKLMELGVFIPCTDGVVISDDSQIESSTTILPGTVISGETFIGKNCVIGPNSVIKNCIIGCGSTLPSVFCSGCKINENTSLKPFSVI